MSRPTAAVAILSYPQLQLDCFKMKMSEEISTLELTQTFRHSLRFHQSRLEAWHRHAKYRLEGIVALM